MSILSLLASFAAFMFIYLAIEPIRINPREPLTHLNGLLSLCFFIWAVSYAFMYSAPDAASALLWSRIGAGGWIFFTAFALHFFLRLAGKSRFLLKPLVLMIVYGIPVVLLIQNSTGSLITTSMAQSAVGLGWTYVSNYQSPWFWGWVVYLFAYFFTAFYLLLRWAKFNPRPTLKLNSVKMVLLITAMLFLGGFTELVLPIFGPFFPPTAILLLVVWSFSTRHVLQTLMFVGVINATTPDLILRTVMNPILMLDSKGIIIRCNQAGIDLLKFPEEQILGRHFSDFMQSGSFDRGKFNVLLREKILQNSEINLIDATGSVIHTLTTLSVAETREDSFVGIVVSIHDVTQMKRIEISLNQSNEQYRRLSEHLVRIANFDELTKLPNRRMFFDKLEDLLADFYRTGHGFSLVYIDLDNFKSINDSYGHAIGDLVLIKVAEIFQSIVRRNDLVARIGGDEFVLLLAECCSDGELQTLLERLRHKFERPQVINGHICPIGLSIGVSQCPEDSAIIDELLRLADERMYGDKGDKLSAG